MDRSDIIEFTSRRCNPIPIDLCPMCGAYLGNNLFAHMQVKHNVQHRFVDVRRPPEDLYLCMCGEKFGIYRHLREHFRDHGVNCYHIYLLTGGDNVRDSG